MRNARLLLAALLAGAALTGTGAAHAGLDDKCEDRPEGDIEVADTIGIDRPRPDNGIIGVCVRETFLGARIRLTDTGGPVPGACVSIFIDEEEIGC